jgi:hypothetical protein
LLVPWLVEKNNINAFFNAFFCNLWVVINVEFYSQAFTESAFGLVVFGSVCLAAKVDVRKYAGKVFVDPFARYAGVLYGSSRNCVKFMVPCQPGNDFFRALYKHNILLFAGLIERYPSFKSLPACDSPYGVEERVDKVLWGKLFSIFSVAEIQICWKRVHDRVIQIDANAFAHDFLSKKKKN